MPNFSIIFLFLCFFDCKYTNIKNIPTIGIAITMATKNEFISIASAVILSCSLLSTLVPLLKDGGY